MRTTKKLETSRIKTKGVSLKSIKKDLWFYILLAPAIIFTFIFSYIPTMGLVIAFKDFDIVNGIMGSPWVGLKHIVAIFEMPMITQAITNTLTINLLALAIVFPMPIILAILLSEVKCELFKRVIQTVSYLPHFLSWISIIAIAYSVYAIGGPINDLREFFFGADTQRIMFMGKQVFFIPNYLMLNIWKEIGWSSIIYLATITSIDQQLYEAARIDGANRFQQIMNITVTSMIPTITLLLILQFGGMFGSNFELTYGLQNAFVNYEVISTLVFKSGIQQAQYSMATAISLAQGLIAFLLVTIANKVSKVVSGNALW